MKYTHTDLNPDYLRLLGVREVNHITETALHECTKAKRTYARPRQDSPKPEKPRRD